MYCDLCSQYIQMRTLFKGGNYSRVETICGNTVFTILDNFLRSFSVSANNFESNFDYDYKIQKKSEFQSPRLQNWFYHISSFSPSSATRLMWQAGNKPDWRRSVLCSLAWIAQAWFFLFSSFLGSKLDLLPQWLTCR